MTSRIISYWSYYYFYDRAQIAKGRLLWHYLLQEVCLVCVRYTNKLWLFVNTISLVVHHDFDIIYNDIIKIILCWQYKSILSQKACENYIRQNGQWCQSSKMILLESKTCLRIPKARTKTWLLAPTFKNILLFLIFLLTWSHCNNLHELSISNTQIIVSQIEKS